MLQIKFANENAFVKNGDVVTVSYQDGSSRDFDSIPAFQSWASGLLNDAIDVLKATAIVHLLTIDPLMDSPDVWNGKTFTLDAEQQTFSNVFKKV